MFYQTQLKPIVYDVENNNETIIKNISERNEKAYQKYIIQTKLRRETEFVNRLTQKLQKLEPAPCCFDKNGDYDVHLTKTKRYREYWGTAEQIGYATDRIKQLKFSLDKL